MAVGGGQNSRERAGSASLPERLAIRRGVYTAIDGIVDGFLARIEHTDFEAASPRHLISRRFGPGQVVLGEALTSAFPQYARLAHASVSDEETLSPSTAIPERTAKHTHRDPYRTIDYRIDEGTIEGEVAHGFVESIVLIEALECYNEIVRMFHDGSADEVHELEDVRRRFQKRYRDLVSLDELDAGTPSLRPAPDGEASAGEPTVLEAFFDYLSS